MRGHGALAVGASVSDRIDATPPSKYVTSGNDAACSSYLVLSSLLAQDMSFTFMNFEQLESDDDTVGGRVAPVAGMATMCSRANSMKPSRNPMVANARPNRQVASDRRGQVACRVVCRKLVAHGRNSTRKASTLARAAQPAATAKMR